MKIVVPLAVRIENNQVMVLQPQFFKDAIKTFPNLQQAKKGCKKELEKLIRASLRAGEVLPEVVSQKRFLQVKRFKKEFEAYDSSFWIEVKVKVNRKFSYFPTIVKTVGQGINIVALVGNSISALLSIQLASEKTSAAAKWTLGSTLATLNFAVLMIMYIFSGASEMLDGMARKIQTLGQKSRFDMTFEEDKPVKKCYGTSYKKIALTIGATAAIGALQVISGINNYQDVYSKGLRFGFEHDSVKFKLILALAWVSTVTYVLNNVVFQGSFAKAFIDHITASNEYGILKHTHIDSDSQSERLPLLVNQADEEVERKPGYLFSP